MTPLFQSFKTSPFASIVIVGILTFGLDPSSILIALFQALFPSRSQNPFLSSDLFLSPDHSLLNKHQLHTENITARANAS